MSNDCYYFADLNLDIAKEINKNQYETYSKLIELILPLEQLIKSYKIVQMQYRRIEHLNEIIDKFPLLSEERTDLTLSSITIYIISNRMFIDNCKNFSKNFEQITKDVNYYDDQSPEKNLRVLRNYANHASLPISDLNFVSTGNLTMHNSKIMPVIDKNKLVKSFKQNSHDKQTIRKWTNGKLEIMPEIIQANIITKKLILKIVRKYIEKNIPSQIKNLVKKDIQLWTDQSIIQSTRGIFKIQDGINKERKYIDSLLFQY